MKSLTMKERFQTYLRNEIEIMLDAAAGNLCQAFQVALSRLQNRSHHVHHESISSIISSNASSIHPINPDCDKMDANEEYISE